MRVSRLKELLRTQRTIGETHKTAKTALNEGKGNYCRVSRQSYGVGAKKLVRSYSFIALGLPYLRPREARHHIAIPRWSRVVGQRPVPVNCNPIPA